jgi:hypothetical protein
MYGLLAPEDKQQAFFQGLLSGGASLLADSGPSDRPRGVLSGIGRGFEGFQQGMQSYGQGVQQASLTRSANEELQARKQEADRRRLARTALLGMDPAKLSDPSSLPMLMAASDDPVSAYTAFQKTNLPQKPLSPIGQLYADYNAGRLPEGVYNAALTKATTNTPLVNMGPGETEEAKGIGRGLADRYNALLEQGAAARKNMGTLADIVPLIDQVSTGTGAGAGIAVKSFMKRVGLDPTSIGLADDVAPAEAFRSLSNQLTLMLRSSEGMPASGFSDADRQFLENIPPNIGNTPEGNKLLARLLKKKFQRTQERAWEAQQYYNRKGTFRGFEAENPAQDIFDMNDREALVSVSQSAMPPFNPAGPPLPQWPSAPKADALPQPNEDALGNYLRENGLGKW